MVRITLLGGPGAGKGTQATRLARRYGVPHISTGDIIRHEIDTDSVLGQQARPAFATGELVADDLVLTIVQQRLQQPDCAAGFILDGYPRTPRQAQDLDRLLTQRGQPLTHAIELEVPDGALLARAAGRRFCPTCRRPYHTIFDPPRTPERCDDDGTALRQRVDDQVEVLMARLAVYHQASRDLEAYYRRAGILRVIDGSGAPDDNQARLLAVVEPARSPA